MPAADSTGNRNYTPDMLDFVSGDFAIQQQLIRVPPAK